MRLNKRERQRALRQMCGTINSDDAIDPKHYFYNKRKARNQFRKSYQLCRQVADTLHLVLTEGDPRLDGLTVIDVVPAPDSRRLLVILGVEADNISSASEVESMLDRLRSHVPRLRSEIARSINRSRVPSLAFEITSK